MCKSDLIKTDIKNVLLSMGEAEYKEFSAKLVPTIEKDKFIGIRTPVLRKIAKKLEDYDEFLNDLPHTYYEENNLHAFLIEREKDFDKCIEKLEKFLPYVDNWATCDSMKPGVLKKEPEKLLKYIKKWIDSDETYTVRYAINLLMSYYLENYFDESFLKLVSDVKSEEYYINMMRAWYFATALVKQYNKTISYLEDKKLDIWTHNKTVRKAIESFRISKEQKEYIRTLKI